MYGWNRECGPRGLGFPVSVNDKSTMDVFTDSGSIFHMGLGFLSGMVPTEWALLIFSLFSGYEIGHIQTTGETLQRTGGKFVEYGIGAGLGAWARSKGKR